MKLLFVCTGNSCRSQMAEGWARHLGADVVEAASAGIEAHGQNPRAVEAMREAGIDITGQASTVLTDEMLEQADMVITVCGHADEQCPALPVSTLKDHWPIEDPARAEGSEDSLRKVFADCRDEIRDRVATLLIRVRG